MARDKRLLADLLRYFDGNDEIRFDEWDAPTIRHHLLLLVGDGCLVEDAAGGKIRVARNPERYPRYNTRPDGSLMEPHIGGMVPAHLWLCGVDADLGPLTHINFHRLTNAGHDLLEALSDDTPSTDPIPTVRHSTEAPPALRVKVRGKQREILDRLWPIEGTVGSAKFDTLSVIWDSKPTDETIVARLKALNANLRKHKAGAVITWNDRLATLTIGRRN